MTCDGAYAGQVLTYMCMYLTLYTTFRDDIRNPSTKCETTQIDPRHIALQYYSTERQDVSMCEKRWGTGRGLSSSTYTHLWVLLAHVSEEVMNKLGNQSAWMVVLCRMLVELEYGRYHLTSQFSILQLGVPVAQFQVAPVCVCVCVCV